MLVTSRLASSSIVPNNLFVFPLSKTSRLKTYFLQNLDLDTGANQVGLTGIPAFINQISSSVPSTAGKAINCDGLDIARLPGLQTCRWEGLPPRSVPNSALGLPASAPLELGYKDWLSFNASRAKDHNTIHFEIIGKNTRACRILFDRPISSFSVDGGASSDPRFERVGPQGSSQIRLWSREWECGGNVSVTFNDDEEGKEKSGKVACEWSDANQAGTIPALEELWRFMPKLSTVVQTDDGLLEGWKRFIL